MEAASTRDNITDRRTGEVVGWHETASVTLEGRTFVHAGATVLPESATAYLSSDMRHINDWNGERIGTACVVRSWPTPRSHLSDRMYQVEARIDGRTYTGRSAGRNMLWRGRVKASQRE